MSGTDEVLVFPEHCPRHGATARRHWVEPAGEGYELPYLVTVEYKCKPEGCLQSQSAAKERPVVRDYANHVIPKTAPPRRIYPDEE